MLAGTPPNSTSLVCPNCGYSLTGLESAGRCPECGRAYDNSEIILHGWARGPYENIGNAKRSRLVWLLVSPVWVLLCQLPQLKFDPKLFYILLGITVLPIFYMALRRINGNHPGLVQVRLTELGCVQYDDLAGPSVIRQSLRSHGWVIPLAGVVILIGLLHYEQIGPIEFWISTILLLICEAFAWRSCSRVRRAMRNVREGSIADMNAAFRRESAWRDIASGSIEFLRLGAYRLRVKRNTHFFTFDATGFAVDAELSCTEAQALAIEDIIKQRIAEASDQSPAHASHLRNSSG